MEVIELLIEGGSYNDKGVLLYVVLWFWSRMGKYYWIGKILRWKLILSLLGNNLLY